MSIETSSRATPRRDGPDEREPCDEERKRGGREGGDEERDGPDARPAPRLGGAGGLHGRQRNAPQGARVTTGIRTVTVVPFPGSLRTAIVPPRSSTARLQIARPRPVPEVFVEK